ncbi:hypothetical protein L209DRAFT_188313 [Thermothelomyces heterothallicus CBS 203.75]
MHTRLLPRRSAPLLHRLVTLTSQVLTSLPITHPARADSVITALPASTININTQMLSPSGTSIFRNPIPQTALQLRGSFRTN